MPIGYIFAVIAAAIVVVVGVLGPFDAEIAGYFAVPLLLMIGYVGAGSLAPAVIAIGIAEVFRLRSIFYFLAVGGAIGFALNEIADFHGSAALLDRRQVLFPAAGFVGAFVYWLIAGRRSGLTQPSARASE